MTAWRFLAFHLANIVGAPGDAGRAELYRGRFPGASRVRSAAAAEVGGTIAHLDIVLPVHPWQMLQRNIDEFGVRRLIDGASGRVMQQVSQRTGTTVAAPFAGADRPIDIRMGR